MIMMRKSGDKWKKADTYDFKNEAELQKLLYESPEIIPTRLTDQTAVFIREAGLPGSGYTDLLGVDSTGSIIIVETKDHLYSVTVHAVRAAMAAKTLTRLEETTIPWGAPGDHIRIGTAAAVRRSA